VAVLAVLRDAGLVRLPLPQNSRQIPHEVLAGARPGRGALRFGFELGTGVRTYLSASAPYVVAAALLLAGSGPLAAVLAGVGFGAGRAATPLVRHAHGDGERWDRRLRSSVPAIVITADLAVALLLAAAWPTVG
jgi:hypothetical protein